MSKKVSITVMGAPGIYMEKGILFLFNDEFYKTTGRWCNTVSTTIGFDPGHRIIDHYSSQVEAIRVGCIELFWMKMVKWIRNLLYRIRM